MSLFEKLKSGLNKSSNAIRNSFKKVVFDKKLDEQTLDEIEELLIMSDMGIEFATNFREDLAKSKFDKEISQDEVKQFLAKKIINVTKPFESEITLQNGCNVFLFCGVNGNGKTTSLGKMAQNFQQKGKKVLIAACDTFRAAAVEQVEFWAKKSQAEFFKGPEKADPASVAYGAFDRAKKENFDVLLIDTAGRLQNQQNLMQELAKISKVIKKIDENAMQNNILVVDATTGQNALNQVEEFNKICHINGLIVTKLDGTAKAGIIIAICQKFKLPIMAIGVGENIEDLRPFKAEEFVENLINS